MTAPATDAAILLASRQPIGDEGELERPGNQDNGQFVVLAHAVGNASSAPSSSRFVTGR